MNGNHTLDFSKDELRRFRNDTAGCNYVNHLNNAGASLMPDVVTNAITDHIHLESQIGGYEASDLKENIINEFYRLAGKLINAKPENIAFTASATDSFMRALSSIPFIEGDVILTDRDGFISNQIQFLSLQKRFGVKLVRIHNTAAGGVDLDDLYDKLHHLRPRLLAITHIPTNSGLVQPVDKIATIYQAYKETQGDSTWYILDACQSIGQRKIDVQHLACDFLSVTNRKFLRGPRGTGFLFISDRALAAGLEPLFLDMRGARWVGDNEYQQQITGVRFEDWEFAYALVLGSAEAIRYCLDVGEHRIQNRIQELSNHLRQLLGAMPAIRLLDRGAEISSTTTFTMEEGSGDHIVTALRSQKINVVASYRNYAILDFNEKNADWAIRVSPHYYNTFDELEEFSKAMNKLITIGKA